MKQLTSILILLFPLFLSAQIFQDNFTDGNLNLNPTWLGDTVFYQVNTNHELQLNDVGGNTSQIYASVITADSIVWEFYFRLEFAPSASNQMKVFLMSDNNNFLGNLNGYFLQIGETGANDAIEIYKQTGNNIVPLFRGIDGAVGADPAEARIKIIKNSNGNWKVFTDYSNGNNFTLEGSFNDNDHTMSNYFGFVNKYSPTRKDKFFFDDITVSPLFQDLTPPNLDTVIAISSDTLIVQFNELLDSTSIQTNDFTIVGIGNPSSAVMDVSDASKIYLVLPSSLMDATNYTLQVSNITDLNANNLGFATKDFTFYDIQIPSQEEVLINEIMADPRPVVGLPDVEFIELYNHSNKSFLLSDLLFFNSGNEFTLPDRLFLAGEYVLLCNTNDVDSLSTFGNIVGIDGFSGLTNSNDDLKLENINGEIIHQVNYTDDWYQDETKKNGGYTLELINPDLVCLGEANWRATNSPIGGTPNQQNSIFDNTLDTQPPSIIDVDYRTDSVLILTFSEKIDSLSTLNRLNYQLNLSFDYPDFVEVLSDFKVKLTFPSILNSQSFYTIEVQNVADCSGNTGIDTFSFQYFDFQEASIFDLLITEIFADPTPSLGLPDAEYIEIYNRSDKIINLDGFIFENRSRSVELTDFILLPYEYVAIHENNILIDFSRYESHLGLESFPTLGNANDELKLINPNGELIDFVNYSSNWYGNSNYEDGGRSLEMISLNSYCENENNWIASEAQWGGTPGAPNSVEENLSDLNSPIIESIFPTSNASIDLFFNEKLQIEAAENLSNYNISNNITVIDAILQDDFQTVTLSLGSSLETNQIYTITIQTAIKDCIGNSALDIQTIQVGLPSDIMPSDVVINEILFNPETGGSDFLELYNQSEKVLNLKDLSISNSDNGQLQSLVEIANDFLFFPNTYVAISENVLDISERYLDSLAEKPLSFGFLVENDLPSFPDDAGGIVLLNQNGERIDEVEYSDDWHHPLIVNDDGVSLERIDFSRESNDKNNWQSAASTVGYATPAYANSQFLDRSILSNEEIYLEKKTFSPNNDGFDDFLLINYNLSITDVVANISIFDANGRLVRQLTQNELLGTSGHLKWDGTSNDKTRCRLGIYVVFIELVQPNGRATQQKLTCVLADRI